MAVQLRAGLGVEFLCKVHCTLHTVQGGKGRFAVFAVAADGFAQLFRCAGDVQHIVHDLEHEPQTVGIGFQHTAGLGVGLCGSGPHLDGRVDQRAGLVAVDQPQLVLGGGKCLIF